MRSAFEQADPTIGSHSLTRSLRARAGCALMATRGGRDVRIITVFLVAMTLAGCQTDSSPPTASGSPEITVTGAKPEQVKPRLVNAAMNRGLKLKNDTAYQITFERPWGGAAGSAIVGALISTDAGPVVERLTFSIADTGDGTRVVLDRYMVKSGRFGREDVSPANNGLGLDPLQTVLDGIAPSLSSETAPTPVQSPSTKRRAAT